MNLIFIAHVRGWRKVRQTTLQKPFPKRVNWLKNLRKCRPLLTLFKGSDTDNVLLIPIEVLIA